MDLVAPSNITDRKQCSQLLGLEDFVSSEQLIGFELLFLALHLRLVELARAVAYVLAQRVEGKSATELRAMFPDLEIPDDIGKRKLSPKDFKKKECTKRIDSQKETEIRK